VGAVIWGLAPRHGARDAALVDALMTMGRGAGFGRRWLATGSNDDAARLWDLSVNYSIAHVCSAGDALTPPLWHTYIPQIPYRPLC
jgi:hypothetical protein